MTGNSCRFYQKAVMTIVGRYNLKAGLRNMMSQKMLFS